MQLSMHKKKKNKLIHPISDSCLQKIQIKKLMVAATKMEVNDCR